MVQVLKNLIHVFENGLHIPGVWWDQGGHLRGNDRRLCEQSQRLLRRKPNGFAEHTLPEDVMELQWQEKYQDELCTNV